MNPSVRALAVATRTELALLLREPAAVLFTLALPLLLLVLNGAQPDLDIPGGVAGLIPGYAALAIATTGLGVLPATLASYRERGVLARYRTTAVSPLVVLLSHLCAHLTMALVGLGILVGVGLAWFDLQGPADPLGTAVAFVVGVLGFFAPCFLLAAWAPTQRAASAVANLVYFPMIFLSGAAFPVQGLPELARQIGRWLPLRLVVDGLARPWLEGGLAVVPTAGLVTLLVVGTLTAARRFRWE